MKVVLFCGGEGMRLRGYSEDVPKPMVTIGVAARTLACHEVLCALWPQGLYPLSWLQSERHQELLSWNTKSLSPTISSSRRVVGKLEFMQRDIDDWKITFVDTGLRSTIADRLRSGRTLS